jgi:hypothetical protein
VGRVLITSSAPATWPGLRIIEYNHYRYSKVTTDKEDIILPADVIQTDGRDLAEEEHNGVIDDRDREANRADLHREDLHSVDLGDRSVNRQHSLAIQLS